MSDDVSPDDANLLIAEARDRLSEATGILEDAAYLSAQKGRKPSDDDWAQLADVVYQWTGKRFNNVAPATVNDLEMLARNMRAKLDAAMQIAAECFRQLATVAVQYGHDPRPFTSSFQLVSLNLSGLLQPDPSKVSPKDMFTTKSFAYSGDVWEDRLRGADHPLDALLKLEHAINTQSYSQSPDAKDGKKPKKKRGAGIQFDPKRDKKISDAWRTRQYAKFADLDSEMGLKQGEAKAAVDRDRKRRR